MKIGVVGAGTMGAGIAQVAAYHGHEVYLQDAQPEALEKGLARIRKSLQKIASKQSDRDPEQLCQETLGRLGSGGELEPLRDAGLVVEAVFENFAVKKSIFEQLDRLCAPETLLASNTSSISITRLATTTNRPQQVIGMHFMNPVPVMKLVEVIRGLATSDACFETTRQLAVELQKIPVEVHDFPGFISNRVLLPMLNEAMFAVMEGVAKPEAVDAVMKLGMNHPMGPLQLADFIGLDVCLDILNVLYEGFKDPKYRPCPLLQQLVDAGRLGRKTGQGFYQY